MKNTLFSEKTARALRLKQELASMPEESLLAWATHYRDSWQNHYNGLYRGMPDYEESAAMAETEVAYWGALITLLKIHIGPTEACNCPCHCDPAGTCEQCCDGPRRGVWVFHAEGDTLAAVAYSTRAKAEQEIKGRHLTGVLTWYCLDQMPDPAIPPEHYHFERE